MNEKHRITIALLKLFDIALLVFTFSATTALSVHMEHEFTIAEFLTMRTRVSNFSILFAALLLCHLIFRICGLYHSRRLSSFRDEVYDVLKAMTLSTAIFVVVGSVFSIAMITVNFLALFWIMGSVLLVLGRFFLRRVAARVRLRGRDIRYMLILGTNPRAVEFSRRIAADKERGYRVLGFVDDEWPGIDGIQETGMSIATDFAGLPEYLRHNVVDEVAIYLPLGSRYQHATELVHLCQQHGITLRFDSDVFGLKSARWRADEFHGNQYLTTFTGSSELTPRMLKRALDLLVSALVIAIAAPLFVFVAIAIKVTSPGPVFFLQDRVGLNKRRFKIYKFRTMVPNAEILVKSLESKNEVSGPVFKIRNDPRITPIGRFLRKTSIDELPQLLNVLKGDMSLVGPRPLPLRDYAGFNEDWQRRRFSVKPGITCLWQVNGRSSISFDEWMMLDLQYMDEWSLWLDLKILMKTVPAVVRGSGAA